MDMISLQGKTNFFEKRVSDYSTTLLHKRPLVTRRLAHQHAYRLVHPPSDPTTAYVTPPSTTLSHERVRTLQATPFVLIPSHHPVGLPSSPPLVLFRSHVLPSAQACEHIYVCRPSCLHAYVC